MASNSRQANAKGRIIWAVDPFRCEQKILRTAAAALRALSRDGKADIQPVYVWANPSMGRPGYFPNARQELEAAGQEELAKALRRIRLPGLLPLQVLVDESESIKGQVQELVSYSRETHADVVLVPSHGRKGLERLFLGSFAEALALRSTVPLFIVHPSWVPKPAFKEILFATDASDESQEAFEKVLTFAESYGCKITLFHRVILPYPVAYTAFDFAFTADPGYQNALQAQMLEVEAEVKKMAQASRERGLTTHVIFDRDSGLSAAEAVLKRARRLNGFVALASQSGPVRSALLGSTTLRLLRSSTKPVWVIHPERHAQRLREVPSIFDPTKEDVETDLRLRRNGKRAEGA